MRYETEDDLEYAALRRDDGTPIPRTAAYRSFQMFEAAISRAGGRAPMGRDGLRQVWNEERGWFDRTETRGMNGNFFSSCSRHASRELSGPGWRISDAAPHADLERLARQIRSAAFRAPWPEGWAVKFGELTGQHADLAAVTLYREKLIIVDEVKSRRRGEDDLRESLLHELTHVACGYGEDCATSQLFHITLNEVRARCPKVVPAWTSSAW